MSRSPQTRKQSVEALVIRLRSCLSEVDHWSKNSDLPDELLGRMHDARVTLDYAKHLVESACKLMPEEK